MAFILSREKNRPRPPSPVPVPVPGEDDSYASHAMPGRRGWRFLCPRGRGRGRWDRGDGGRGDGDGTVGGEPIKCVVVRSPIVPSEVIVSHPPTPSLSLVLFARAQQETRLFDNKENAISTAAAAFPSLAAASIKSAIAATKIMMMACAA